MSCEPEAEAFGKTNHSLQTTETTTHFLPERVIPNVTRYHSLETLKT